VTDYLFQLPLNFQPLEEFNKGAEPEKKEQGM
jgi:hypothetical protein